MDNFPFDASTPHLPFTRITRRFIDPLSTAFHKQKAHRNAERQAQKINNTINERLREERVRTRGKATVLLLGQSESGKSTLLKHFQLAFAPNSFQQERLIWRPVVYLNLVHSVRHILDTLSSPETVLAKRHDSIPQPDQLPLATSNSIFDSPEYAELRVQLQPLLDLEFELTKRLPPSHDSKVAQQTSSSGTPSARQSGNAKATASNWENAVDPIKSIHDLIAKEVPNWWNDPTDPCHVLNHCKPYIEQLWNDPTIKSELARRNVYPEERPEHHPSYLDSLSRITDIKYTPSDDDILKSRLKTVGIVERIFPVQTSDGRIVDWNVYDVAGARNQRQAWVPYSESSEVYFDQRYLDTYFHTVGTLIFVAPISAFDETLAEDPNVNRLEDILSLWQSIVSNRLLNGVYIILFLNKCDLLKAKLDRGVRVSQHIPAYGDRPNDYHSVLHYFESTFLRVHQLHSPNPDRMSICHQTDLTDTSQTSSIIDSVRQAILFNELRDCGLI